MDALAISDASGRSRARISRARRRVWRVGRQRVLYAAPQGARVPRRVLKRVAKTARARSVHAAPPPRRYANGGSHAARWVFSHHIA